MPSPSNPDNDIPYEDAALAALAKANFEQLKAAMLKKQAEFQAAVNETSGGSTITLNISGYDPDLAVLFDYPALRSTAILMQQTRLLQKGLSCLTNIDVSLSKIAAALSSPQLSSSSLSPSPPSPDAPTPNPPQ